MNPRDTIARKFALGDRVTKTKGSSWTGKVVGFYSTDLTPVGYAVESENEPGSVQIYPEAALTAAGHRIVGPADMEAEDLDSRMKAAGMIPLSDLLSGNTPLEKWMAHTGVRDLDTFEQWLGMRQREFGHMVAGYELGDKDKTDELYEWVHSHFSALNEVAANLRQMKRRMAEAAPPHMPVPDGWQKHYDMPEHLALDLRQIAENFDCRVGYPTMDAQIMRRAASCFDGHPEEISSSKARSMLSAAPKPAALTQEPKIAEEEK